MSQNNSAYDCGFDKNVHMRWGKATREPLFRKGAHGRLELISNPNTQIQRSEKNNKWVSVSLKQQKTQETAQVPA